MDNLDSAIEYGYITEKEAELLELLRMPAKDAKPPKGVPKTHVPKKHGKSHPKETLKKLSPKQKATLKAKTDGKVDKTKDGIDSFVAPPSTVQKAANQATMDTAKASGSSYSSPTGPRGTTGMQQGSNNYNSPSQDTKRSGESAAPVKGTQNASREAQGNVHGSLATLSGDGKTDRAEGVRTDRAPVSTTVSGDGKSSRENVTTINQNGSIINKTDPNRPYGANTTDIAKAAPSDLDDIMAPPTKAERAIGKVKQPTSFARIDSPSSLETMGRAGSVFESPLADRPGVYSGSELNDVVGSAAPARANQPTREAYAENVASDPTAGQTNSSLASLAGNPEKTDGQITPSSPLAENYAAYRLGVVPPESVEAARVAILGEDVAQPAGTLTTPYDPLATAAGTVTAPYEPVDPNFQASLGRYGVPEINPPVYKPPAGSTVAMTTPPAKTPSLAQAAGTLTTPYDVPAEDLSQDAYDRANAIPGVTPASAAPTTQVAEPDSPLSPLATAKPRALGLEGYQGPQASAVAAGTLTTPYNAPANDNVSELQGLGTSTIADQNMPNTSTIADQSLPGGLPSATTPRAAPTTSKGGQGVTPAAAAPEPAAAAPPAPVVEQIDPYAGIMPWDRIAYDAIKTSFEGRGQAYTPAQFIASFYNMKQAA